MNENIGRLKSPYVFLIRSSFFKPLTYATNACFSKKFKGHFCISIAFFTIQQSGGIIE